MNKLDVCKICGAENLTGDDISGRCYNCDNDLPSTANGSRSGKRGQSEDSIYAVFAGFYALLFMFGLGCYLLSAIDSDPGEGTGPVCLALTMIAVLHGILVKRVENIVGYYKGPKRYTIQRHILLYGIIGLIIYEVTTYEVPSDKDRVFYLLMMMQSLMLFYTYYYGKKSNGLNCFNNYKDRR